MIIIGTYLFLKKSSPPTTENSPASNAVATTSSLRPNAVATTSEPKTVSIDHAATGTLPTIRVMGGAIYEHDYSIDKYLMGESHNVFVAKIIKKIGEVTRAGTPATQFEAEAIFNVKGNISGTITVEQEGGYLNGVLYVAYGEFMRRADKVGAGYLLEPGSTYLLATRHIKKDDPFVVVEFPSAVKLISENGLLSNTQLQALAENDSRTKQLQMAYPIEVLDSSDVYNHTALNSYQSLTEAEKYALPYYTGSYNLNPTSTATSTF